jgi:hypothetical protein
MCPLALPVQIIAHQAFDFIDKGPQDLAGFFRARTRRPGEAGTFGRLFWS